MGFAPWGTPNSGREHQQLVKKYLYSRSRREPGPGEQFDASPQDLLPLSLSPPRWVQGRAKQRLEREREGREKGREMSSKAMKGFSVDQLGAGSEMRLIP